LWLPKPQNPIPAVFLEKVQQHLIACKVLLRSGKGEIEKLHLKR
jgi:hypothetical protein